MKCKSYTSVLTASWILAIWPVAGALAQDAKSASPDAAKAGASGESSRAQTVACGQPEGTSAVHVG